MELISAARPAGVLRTVGKKRWQREGWDICSLVCLFVWQFAVCPLQPLQLKRLGVVGGGLKKTLKKFLSLKKDP